MNYLKTKKKLMFDILKDKMEKTKKEVLIITEDFVTFENIKDIIKFEDPSVLYIESENAFANAFKEDENLQSIILVDLELLIKYDKRIKNIAFKNKPQTIIVFSNDNIEYDFYQKHIESDSTFGIIESYNKNKLSFNVMIDSAIKKHFQTSLFKSNTDAIDDYVSLLKKTKNYSIEELIKHMKMFFNQFQQESNIGFIVVEKNEYKNNVTVLGKTDDFYSKKYNDNEDFKVKSIIEQTLIEKNDLEYEDYQSFYYSNNAFRELIFVFKGVNSSILLSKRVLELILSLNAGFILKTLTASIKEDTFINSMKEIYLSDKKNNNNRKVKLGFLEIFFNFLNCSSFDKNNIVLLFLMKEMNIKSVKKSSILFNLMKKLNVHNVKDIKESFKNESMFRYYSILTAIDLIEKNKNAKQFLENDFYLDEEVVKVIRENIVLFSFGS